MKELKKAKRKLKTSITKSLTDLAGRLSESKPDRTGIKAVLEGIEERKQEVLLVMEELESALDKEEQTDEAEKIGDEADSLIDKIDQETSQCSQEINWSFNNGLLPFLPVWTPHRWRLNSRC